MGEYAEYEIEDFINGFIKRCEKKVQQIRSKTFRCECGKRFVTEQGLNDHSKAVHPDDTNRER